MPDHPTLLVLGASTYQLPVIRRAKLRGWRVITTDNLPENPGHRLADVARGADTTDVGAVLAVARAERVDGVIAPCTDVAVPTAAVVADELGLPGPPPEAARLLCDKLAFRTWQGNHSLPFPAFAPISSSEARWPGSGAWVLKPTRSSGSKGVFVVRSEDELKERLPQTLIWGGLAVLEAFLPGGQITCEGLLRDGVPVATWVSRRETASLPFVATWGHRIPSGLAGAEEEAVLGAVMDVFRRLSVRDGPFDADVVWDGKRATVLEATPRLGGNSLSTLVKTVSGTDLVDEAILCACGRPFGTSPPRSPPSPGAIVLLGVMGSGRLRYDEEAARKLASEPWVATMTLDKHVGDEVEPFINGRHRVGEVVLTAETPERLARRCDEVRARLALRVE